MVVLDLKKQKRFNYDQFYVVLTCAKSLLDLIAVRNLKKEIAKAHLNVIKEYERLRSDSNAAIDKGSGSSQKFITLLNIQSVCKHVAVVDCFADERLNQSSYASQKPRQVKTCTYSSQILFKIYI